MSSIYLNSTLAYCTHCGQTETARILAKPEGVFMERLCPKLGAKSIKIAADPAWYQERLSHPQNIHAVAQPKPSKHGCPNDCGICAWHNGGIHLPVFSITNDCNLDCPICFTYNRPDQKYYKTPAEVAIILEHLFSQTKDLQLINLTGGEPSLHPQLFEIFETCYAQGIKRITMNTNGIRLAQDPLFAKKIKESGVQLVLSLDTLNPEKSVIIHGLDITQHKIKALQVMEELDIPATILHVCIKGVNEQETAEIVQSTFKKSFVKSVTIQNMTFTGKNGRVFEPREHITIDEVEQLLAQKPDFSQADFFPLASYHPLCYSVAYYIASQEKFVSLTRVLEKNTLQAISENSYLLNPQKDYSREFLDGLNRLWAEGEDEHLILSMKKLVQSLHPSDGTAIDPEGRRKLAEKMFKMIYIHPHMDEDNFDIDRVSRCGDIVPDENGRMIPACAYNLLYRQKDQRYWIEK